MHIDFLLRTGSHECREMWRVFFTVSWAFLGPDSAVQSDSEMLCPLTDRGRCSVRVALLL